MCSFLGYSFRVPPYAILDAWRRGIIKLVLSPEILVEYQDTGAELSAQFPDVDLGPWLELATTHALVVDGLPLPEQVCTDADDDKFLVCALASRTKQIVSGDEVGPPEPPDRGRLQTTSSCCGQEPWW